jgi:D-xylose transport system substrate-binding protein
MLAIAATGMLIIAGLTACGDSDEPGGADGSNNPRVGVLLPDSKSSQRWAKDTKYFRAAFGALGIPVDIQNAGGDPATFMRLGDKMINSGVEVLIIANVDALSGKVVLDKAGTEKIPTIDYDRLTLGGGADYYVSFDNERIGQLQGYGLTRCIRLKKAVTPMVAELNGSPTDGNAAVLKDGYDWVLQSRYDNGDYRKGPDQFVPDWDGDQARVVFEQMLRQQPGIGAVLAANDDIADAVIEVLKKNKLNGKVPVTGQDATVEGLRNVLSGDQCLTIYKRLEPEAYTAAGLAGKLFKGETPKVSAELQDPETGAFIPFAAIPPVSIEAAQVKDVVAEGFVTQKELCAGDYLALCERYGVE